MFLLPVVSDCFFELVFQFRFYLHIVWDFLFWGGHSFVEVLGAGGVCCIKFVFVRVGTMLVLCYLGRGPTPTHQRLTLECDICQN